ncbi:carbamate kinase [Mesoterricola sediminis]|uniref:Carbamate kinase n=1 Tax=Mesoterricola sediminis TaxID=2927980 RepID=A0AA48GT74_9BACT|nr:carbamate kinase [Mesoterricola sediminis]BDU77259.1 carbamate kinase [Mesoterricola sediminis]
MAGKIALIAIGGNALLQEKHRGLQEEQLDSARQTAEMFGNVIRAGYSLCIVHGNGPQVGNILIQQEEAANRIPPYTLDICDAMTQGSMGYMIERTLINRLAFLGQEVPVTTVLTEVVVDKDDPGFQNPTKPVGPFYREHRALELQAQKRWHMKEDSGRGWRKVVPSPKPLEIVQLEAIKLLLGAGHCVIAGGGGGIPVIRDASGLLVGVEAVIDKDRLSSLLAEKLGADTYVILTGVPKVALDFGKPTQRWVDRLTASEAARHLAEGQFPPGSMGPKIESALAFLQAGGSEVLITSPDALEKEDYATVGTRIVKD